MTREAARIARQLTVAGFSAAMCALAVSSTPTDASRKEPGLPANDMTSSTTRPRLREAGIVIGRMEPGPLNAITDVPGVRVGHTTVVQGDSVRTGVTAILPHSGNLFREKVPAAIHAGNGFGKLIGYTQVKELGELETPILLTATLNAFRAADALVDYTLAQPGNENVRSLNPVVGETNDGVLNDIRGRHVTREHCLAAIDGAATGKVAEGCVGAGTGTVAFNFKGGIGTASRRLHTAGHDYLVGVLVQSNYGGDLMIAGVPVGRRLGRHGLTKIQDAPSTAVSSGLNRRNPADGSIMIVVATDAPVDARNLERMAARTMIGLGRTGASGSNGSGDYGIAFSVAPQLRIQPGEQPVERLLLPNSEMSPLFEAVIEATEEAVANSLFQAVTIIGSGNRVEALPLAETMTILRDAGSVQMLPDR